MTLPRGHHFNPQFLLRGFTNQNGMLFVFDKRRPESGVFETGPGNVFKQRDLNAIERTDGTKDYTLEDDFTDLESRVAPIVENLVDYAETGENPELTDEEKADWDEFFYRQFSRAPDAFGRLGITDNFDDDWANAIEEFEQKFGSLSAKMKSDLTSPKDRSRRLHNTIVHSRRSSAAPITDMLSKKGMAIATVPSVDLSFVTGDHPHVGSGGKLEAADTELWLPISSTALVSPWGAPGAIYRHVLRVEDVREFNEAIFAKCNLVAGRSRELIQSLKNS